jgi:hypothetical protein
VQKDEYEALLSDLEVRLERLRSLYEQYFIGIEKLEPAVARKDVDRRFWDLRRVRIRNTALRFRFQTLTQRYNTLQQYWMRICRQIEAGTYSRHMRKAAKLASLPPAPLEPSPQAERKAAAGRGADGAFDLGQMLAQDLATDTDVGDAVEAAFKAAEASATPGGGKQRTEPGARPEMPSPSTKGAAKQIPRTPAKRPPDATDSRFSALHAELSKARQTLKQGDVSLQSVANRLKGTEAQLRAKHPGKTVDFRVEVKDGKAVITPFLR